MNKIEYNDTQRLEAIASGCCVGLFFNRNTAEQIWVAEEFGIGYTEGKTIREAIDKLIDLRMSKAN